MQTNQTFWVVVEMRKCDDDDERAMCWKFVFFHNTEVREVREVGDDKAQNLNENS